MGQRNAARCKKIRLKKNSFWAALHLPPYTVTYSYKINFVDQQYELFES